MGGRGSNSAGKHGGIGGGVGAGGSNGRGGVFHDKTQQFAGMSLHDFENEIRGKSVEYIGIFDENGTLMVAGTSNSKGHVALPDLPQGTDYSKLTLTHNHPSGNGRGLGGTFSPADIKNHAEFGFKQTRAVANGRGEHSYIITTMPNANPAGLKNFASNAGTAMRNRGNALIAKVQKQFDARGQNVPLELYNKLYLGSQKKFWAGEAEKNGYQYIALKKAPW